jgi:transcriptional regulator with XRE-family HTH domain
LGHEWNTNPVDGTKVKNNRVPLGVLGVSLGVSAFHSFGGWSVFGLISHEWPHTVAPMTNTPGPLGQRTAAEIRAEIARQKKSGRWLADKIGAPHNTVSRWIGGDTAPPLDALYAMCRALGINVADLISEALADGDYEPVVPLRRRRGTSDTPQDSGRDTHQFAALPALVDAA